MLNLMTYREACINFKELCKKKHADRLWMEELAAVEACSPSELPLLGASGIVLANGIGIPNPNFSTNGASTGDHSPTDTSEASNGAVDGKKGISQAYGFSLPFLDNLTTTYID